MDRSPVLRRYTDLAALIHLLREKKITLLDPESWDDKNDSHYLEQYRKRRRLRAVLALFFTESSETYHHWRVFASGASGVCISFRRIDLLSAVNQHKLPIHGGKVTYSTLEQLRTRRPKIDELPFLKRYAFWPEAEFRLIHESAKALKQLPIPFPLSCIERVTLSPWLPRPLLRHLKSTIQLIPGCDDLNIYRSTLIDNKTWKKFGDRKIR